MSAHAHQVEQYRSALAGVDAISLVSNRSFPRHSHDQLGFGVLHRGTHRSWSGLGMVEAACGDVICVNPGEVHDGASPGGAVRGWRMLYVDPQRVDLDIGQEFPGRREIVRPVIHDPLLATQFSRLFAALTAPRPDRFACEEHLLRCLTRLFREHGVLPPGAIDPVSGVTSALERLQAQPQEPVSLGELAELTGLSRFQFLRAFTRQTGITPHAYLMQLRVRMAQRLLREGRSIAEAAGEAGFADQSHLTRCFVRQFGVTPSRYRAAVC